MIDVLAATQICVIVPCRNEAAAIARLAREARSVIPHVLVVDDGSTDATVAEAHKGGAEVFSMNAPAGKGRALRAGFQHAAGQGYDWAVTLDGDGQHLPEEIHHLLREQAATSANLVIGNRMANPAGMPAMRRWANRSMSALLSRLTGLDLPDTQCGFRLLRLAPPFLNRLRAGHFEIESDQLIAALRCGWIPRWAPISTIYHAGPTRIRPVLDTLRWSRWLAGTLLEAGKPPKAARAQNSRNPNPVNRFAPPANPHSS